MNFKHFHNNGSNIFTLYDFYTEKEICKINIKRTSHNLIQVDKKVYRMVAASGLNNDIGVKKLTHWIKKPQTTWIKNNLFRCPYCLHTTVRNDDFNMCLICKSLTNTCFVYLTCAMPDILTKSYQENQLVTKLRSNNFKISIYKKIEPRRRGKVTKYEKVKV